MKTETNGMRFARSAAFALLLLSGCTARLAAENWVYVTRDDFSAMNVPSQNLYIDADSAVLKGNTLYFSELQVNDQPDSVGVKKTVFKEQADLSGNPWKWTALMFIQYDSNGKEIHRYVPTGDMMKFTDVYPTYRGVETVPHKLIAAAVRYAKSQ